MLFRTVSARRIVMSLLVPLAFLNACAGAPDLAVPTQASSEGVRAISASEANELERALQNDADAQALGAMGTQLAARATAAGVTPSAYKIAFQNHGVAGAADLIGMPRAEFEEFAGRFQRHFEALVGRYPAIAEIQQRTAVLTSAPVSETGVASAAEEEGGCRLVGYTICVAVCATLGGPLAILCALECVCQFCTAPDGGPVGGYCDW